MKKLTILLCSLFFASSLIAKTDGSNDMTYDGHYIDYSVSHVPEEARGEFVFTENDYLSLIAQKMGYKYLPGECDLSKKVKMINTGVIYDHLMEMGYLIGEKKEIVVTVKKKEIHVEC